jgi:hypothetical protein
VATSSTTSRVGAATDRKTIGESQQYLRHFARIVDSEEAVAGIVLRMLELHQDRDNPRVICHTAAVSGIARLRHLVLLHKSR